MDVLQAMGCTGLSECGVFCFQSFPQHSRVADGCGAAGFGSLFAEEEQPVRVVGGLGHLVVKWNEGFRWGLVGGEHAFGSIDAHGVGKGFFIGEVGEIKSLHESIKVEVRPEGQTTNENCAVIPGQGEEFILFRMDLPVGGLQGFNGAGRRKGKREDPVHTGELVGQGDSSEMDQPRFKILWLLATFRIVTRFMCMIGSLGLRIGFCNVLPLEYSSFRGDRK